MVDRRTYLKLVGATVASGGVAAGAGCSTPFNDDPEDSDDDSRDPGGPEDSDDDSGDPDDPEEPDDDTEVPNDLDTIQVNYDQYDQPADVYRVWTGDPSSYSFVDNRVYTGNSTLRCVIPEGESSGSNAMYWFPANGQGQPYEVYQRIMVSLSEDWWMEMNDVCRFWCSGLNTEAGIFGSGGRGAPTGNDGWSSMLAVTNRDRWTADEYRLATYTYHIDQATDSGEFQIIEGDLRPGEWYELETHVWMNTITDGEANPDGELRIWIDGDLIHERTDYRWTTTNDQAIEYAGPLVRYGGSETAPLDLSLYYDDHELATGNDPYYSEVF